MPTALNKVKDVMSPKKDAEKDRVVQVKGEIHRLEENRKRWEYKWREAEEFDSGRHFVVFDRQTSKFIPMKSRPGTTFRVNHISWKKKRELQNTILMNDPRWKILPDPEAVFAAQDEEQLDTVMNDTLRIKQWMDEIYREKQFKALFADEVEKAIVYPYSWMWLDMDEVTYEINPEVGDAFDVLFEGDLSDAQKLPSITKIFKRDIDELKANPKYRYTEKIKPDNRMAGSDIKNDRAEDKYQGGAGQKSNTVICYETWKKVYLTDETRKQIIDFDIKNGNYKKEKLPQPAVPVMDEMGTPVYNQDGTPVMMEQPPVDSRHWCEELPDSHVVMYKTVTTKDCDYFHLEEYIDFPIYPCDIYKTETGAFFKPSWLERMMSANKSLDMLQSRAEEYVATAGGRIMKHENTNISRSETDVGTALEWSGAQAPVWENAPDLPSTLLERIASLKAEIADLTVVGGNVAEVAHNGRGQGAMESIKSADMASVKTPVDLFALHVERIATIILTLADYYMDKPQVVRRIDGVSNKPDYFSVIGARYTETEAYRASSVKAIPVSPATKVKVEIEPGIAMTPQARFDMLIEMFNLGLADQQTILEQAKFENIGEIMARTEKRAQFSMIDTPDFNALDDEVKLTALTNAMRKNIDMPRDAATANNGVLKPIGTAKKISQGGRGNG